jgi:hypothetical protein
MTSADELASQVLYQHTKKENYSSNNAITSNTYQLLATKRAVSALRNENSD